MADTESGWEVRPRNLYKLHTPDRKGPGIYATLCVEAGEDGAAEGGFRIALAADKPLSCRFRGKEVSTIKDLQDITFVWELRAESVELRDSMMSTAWADLIDLLDRGDVQAFSAEGGEDQAVEVMHTLAEAYKDKHSGIALRWAFRATTARGLALEGLALPVSGKAIKKKPVFDVDSCPGIRIFHEPVNTTQGRGCWRGPKPVLFTADPGQTKKALENDPLKLWPGKTVAKN